MRMRGYSEFKGYRTRVVYDAGSKSFEARRMAGPIADCEALDARIEKSDAQRPASDAAKPLPRKPKVPDFVIDRVTKKLAAERHRGATGG
jgi:hypothetical protein